MSRARHWCFTLNNYTPEHVEQLKQLGDAEGTDYLVFGEEVSGTGTPHLQGYIVFGTRRRLAGVKRELPGQPHCEVARGSPRQNQDYCKKDGSFHEFGVCPSGQGGRTDLRELQEAIAQGDSVLALQDRFFGQYLRYHRGIEKIIQARAEQRNWETEVKVYWGPTGTGKTRRVYEETEGDVYMHPGGQWFDGYNGQRNALFDDFGGSEFKLTYLLKLLDRYPMRCPVKGGFVSWVPRVIYITSNRHPSDWYMQAHAAHHAAMMRRISSIEEIQ